MIFLWSKKPDTKPIEISVNKGMSTQVDPDTIKRVESILNNPNSYVVTHIPPATKPKVCNDTQKHQTVTLTLEEYTSLIQEIATLKERLVRYGYKPFDK